MTDLHELRTELQWCIENGCHGPRTESALRWAMEAIDKVIAESEKTTEGRR